MGDADATANLPLSGVVTPLTSAAQGTVGGSVPATLVNASTLTYQDADGDTVTVKLSKPLLSAGNADNVFGFDTGKVNGDNSLKQQLQHIDLGSFAAAGNGTNITITAVRSAVTPVSPISDSL